LSIEDKGIGISEEDQQHLFERFFRAKNAINIQGTGLGLHIISKYLELMGGYIEIKSALNKGSVFTIYIPFKKKIK
jgi:signal transduction histidine kinase